MDDGVPIVASTGVAALVSLFSIVLAVLALRNDRGSLTTVSPNLKCFVAGLLSGLGLLVMLPSAMDAAALPAEHVMLVFVAAPFSMFFVHHVLLGHSHVHASGHQHLMSAPQIGSSSCVGSSCVTSCVCEAPAGQKVNLFGQPKPMVCVTVGTPMCTALEVTPQGRLPVRWLGECAMVLLRALPYLLHAMIDGAILGTASSWPMLVSLMLCIALCAVQDVGTIIVNLSASGATRRVKLITSALFAIGFPLGAALGADMAASAASTDGAQIAMAELRAFAAGLFIYMALFELAPPHAHGRLTSAGYMLAFSAGMVLILASEAVEGSLPTVQVGLELSGASNASVGGVDVNTTV